MKRWPQIRAGAIALVILLGLIEGCPLPNQPLEWQRPIVDAIRPVQRTVLAPFDWIPQRMRFSQRWRLFPGSSPNRYRFEVEGRTAAGWVQLYRAGDPEHDEYRELLEYRRVRGGWNPRSRGEVGQYRAFAKWFATRVLEDHPEIGTVRLQMERIRIEDGTVTDQGGEAAFQVIHQRGR